MSDEALESRMVVAWCPWCRDLGEDRSFHGLTEPAVCRKLVGHFWEDHGMAVLTMKDALEIVRGEDG